MAKNAVVTGGTKGIGKEISRQLVAKGYSVLIIGRDKKSGISVKSEIENEFSNASIEYLRGDLGSIKSSKEVIQGIKRYFSGIDVLINNAGIWPTKLSINEDGLEMGFMVNHIAPLMLIHGLLEELKQNSPSRIVNVNAGLYIKGELKLSETPYGKDFHRLKTYANTKLCNTLTTLELAERLSENDITINAVHPGVIRTGLGDFGGVMGMVLRLVKRFWATPKEGAKAPVWIGTAPELSGKSGIYYNQMEEMEISTNAKDEDMRKALWDKSLELIGIHWNE